MATPVIMPKFSMTQEEATVVRWLAAEGDSVEKGDPLLEVETDKVNMEVEAPASGLLQGLLVSEGDVVPVTEVIAYITDAGERVPDAPHKKRAVDTPPAAPDQNTGAAPRADGVAATPVARRVADVAGIDIGAVAPATRGARVRREDVERFLARQEDAASGNRVRATPAARRVAREHEVDLTLVDGSGPRRRVQEADVCAFVEDSAAPDAAPLPLAGDIVALQGMRRTIASRLQQSYQTIPHVTFTVTVDMASAEALRQAFNQHAAASGASLSVTALLVKVCAWALLRHRFLNASLRGEEIHLHDEANVGVAVAVEDGLIVPVVHGAERLGLETLASLLQDLVARAQSGNLTLQDVSGGTFTISNLGMFGIDQFTAIINPPQSAILAVGRIRKHQVVLSGEGGDRVAIRPMMKMTLAVDHRIVDGAVAARFLQDVVAALEEPQRLLW